MCVICDPLPALRRVRNWPRWALRRDAECVLVTIQFTRTRRNVDAAAVVSDVADADDTTRAAAVGAAVVCTTPPLWTAGGTQQPRKE